MRYLKVLYVQVIIGIIAGIIVGYFIYNSPENGGWVKTVKLISDLFISMIKMVIAPVIFFTVVLGIVGAGNLKKVGRVGGKALIYFEVVTTLALIIGLVVANTFKPGEGIDTRKIGGVDITPYTSGAAQMDWREFIYHIVPSNVIDAFAKGDIIQILFFGILFSFGLRQLGA